MVNINKLIIQCPILSLADLSFYRAHISLEIFDPSTFEVYSYHYLPNCNTRSYRNAIGFYIKRELDEN